MEDTDSDGSSLFDMEGESDIYSSDSNQGRDIEMHTEDDQSLNTLIEQLPHVINRRARRGRGQPNRGRRIAP